MVNMQVLCDYSIMNTCRCAVYLQVWHLHRLAPATVHPDTHAGVHFQDAHSASAQFSASDPELCPLH